MKRFEVSGAIRPMYGSLGVKRLSVQFELVWKRREFPSWSIKPLNVDLNPICHLLALLGAHHIFHLSRIRVNY